MLSKDTPTELTAPHLAAINMLQSLGYWVEAEVLFPPKTVDIYLPEYHAAVEIDGPQHSLHADQKRDDFLMSKYALPVFHVGADMAGTPFMITRLLEAVLRVSWRPTALHRKWIWEDSRHA